ncbi:50S ribosomal protein L35 [Caldisericum sp. AR60]|uniref:50S ribosomal protein L35 n=1 Tax=Caldisericum sp. AR60 TaxID=3397852 RepID=UPI0039FD9D10
MKRFRVTGSGKLVAYGANYSHHLEKKSSRRKKRLNSLHVISKTDVKNILGVAPYLK